MHTQSAHHAPREVLDTLPASELSRSSFGLEKAQQLATIRHFAIKFFNRENNILGRHVFSFECSAPDCSDAVIYDVHRGELRLALQQYQHPALQFRRFLPVLSDGESFGSCYRLPKVCTGPAEVLGGPYLPSAGSSIEMATLVGIPSNLAGKRCETLSFVPIKEIIARYLNGEPSDTRVVLAALRLADHLNFDFSLSLPLEPARYNGYGSGWRVAKASASSLRRHLRSRPVADDAAFGIECQEVDAPAKAFLTKHELSLDGDAVVRRGIDAVDVGAYAWDGDCLCLLMKRGIRPALAVRSLLAGKTPDPTEALAYEGIAESLEGDNSLEAIGLRAAQGVREEAGLEPCGCPHYIGSSYPSPALHTERAFNFLVQVDPTKSVDAEHTIDERIDVFAVPVGELIALCDEGTIRDPRLEINARILSRAIRR